MSDMGLQAIQSRIGRLDALTNGQNGAVRSLGSIAEFEPFGEAYQAAIQQRDRSGLTAPTSGTQFTRNAYATAYPSATAYPAATSATATPLLIGTMSSGLPGLPGVDDARVAAAVDGRVAPPGARPPGGYGSMPVPDVLRALGNGKIPPSALTELSQGHHRLYAPAAASWNNLVEAARADGVELRITDSYRSYDEQVDLVRRKGLYSQGGLAATPGTSNHGWGMAVDADVTDAATRTWLQVNGPRFGWVESVPREPWHWEFRPAQV
jgi:hypothetical protein